MKEFNISDYANEKKDICLKNDYISEELYQKYSVNRGLRDLNGKGVLTGLTNISQVLAFKDIDGVKTPIDGELWYRGYKVNSLIEEIKPNDFDTKPNTDTDNSDSKRKLSYNIKNN